LPVDSDYIDLLITATGEVEYIVV